MDEAFAVVIVFWVAISTVVTGAFWMGGTLDRTVIEACEERGYWQTDQTRVLCSVEAKK